MPATKPEDARRPENLGDCVRLRDAALAFVGFRGLASPVGKTAAPTW